MPTAPEIAAYYSPITIGGFTAEYQEGNTSWSITYDGAYTRRHLPSREAAIAAILGAE